VCTDMCGCMCVYRPPCVLCCCAFDAVCGVCVCVQRRVCVFVCCVLLFLGFLIRFGDIVCVYACVQLKERFSLITKRIRPCRYPILTHGSAWKAWTQYENTSGIGYLNSKWNVPPMPQSASNQILYFWNGVEPAANT